MMDYVKTILLKVSFDKKLFEKELRKGLNMLVPSELEEFREWCYRTFAKIYEPILNKYFIRLAG
ncbi:hypothetical protein [Negadavirga shengliensis]|uniref:Transposase n=1 Tax=Negadavirga shengliensis TaxID=1389218 RepID=A0ABV9SVW5_9BACT